MINVVKLVVAGFFFTDFFAVSFCMTWPFKKTSGCSLAIEPMPEQLRNISNCLILLN